MTTADCVLWNALRKEGIPGLRFRRQHAIGRFVLDFYCPAERLAIEVDGGVHDDPDQAEYDRARTGALSQLGIRVLRVRNDEVMTNMPGVIERIKFAVIPEEYRKAEDLH